MYTLVGKQEVDFVDKGTGDVIKGVKLHYTCPDDRVSGLAVDTKFVRADSVFYDKVRGFYLGPFSMVYGAKGRVVDYVQESVPEDAAVKSGTKNRLQD